MKTIKKNDPSRIIPVMRNWRADTHRNSTKWAMTTNAYHLFSK